jgi:hypothetical protein
MDIQEEIISLREAVARIETKLDNWPKCPNPGFCNVLEPRVRLLESAEDKRMGGWIGLTAMLAAASTIGALFANLIKINK